MSLDKIIIKKLDTSQISKNNTFFPAFDHLDKIMGWIQNIKYTYLSRCVVNLFKTACHLNLRLSTSDWKLSECDHNVREQFKKLITILLKHNN